MGELQVEALLPDIKVISGNNGFKIQRIKYFTISTPNHLRQKDKTFIALKCADDFFLWLLSIQLQQFQYPNSNKNICVWLFFANCASQSLTAGVVENLDGKVDDFNSTDDGEASEETHGASDGADLSFKVSFLIPLDLVEGSRVKEDLHKLKCWIFLHSWKNIDETNQNVMIFVNNFMQHYELKIVESTHIP